MSLSCTLTGALPNCLSAKRNSLEHTLMVGLEAAQHHALRVGTGLRQRIEQQQRGRRVDVLQRGAVDGPRRALQHPIGPAELARQIAQRSQAPCAPQVQHRLAVVLLDPASALRLGHRRKAITATWGALTHNEDKDENAADKWTIITSPNRPTPGGGCSRR